MAVERIEQFAFTTANYEDDIAITVPNDATIAVAFYVDM